METSPSLRHILQPSEPAYMASTFHADHFVGLAPGHGPGPGPGPGPGSESASGSAFGGGGTPATAATTATPATTATTTSTATSAATDGALNANRKRPATRIKSTYPRKRALQACTKCRVRRTKCNNMRPSCSSCLSIGAECTYSEGDHSSFDSASLAILDKLNAIEEILKGSSSPRKAGAAMATAAASQGADADSRASSSLWSPINSPTLERSKDASCFHMNIEGVLSWSVFDDLSPNLNLKALLNPSTATAPGPSTLATGSEFDEHVNEEILVDAFMNSVFIYNPVVEEAKIHRYVREARLKGLEWDAQSCLLLLIYALGCIGGPIDGSPQRDASSFRHSTQFKRSESYFAVAQKRMGLLLCGTGVLEAQCFFLAGVYLMATLRPMEAWKMFVQALTCCQALYTEKESPDLDRESEQRLRKSIYWTCFKSELELRLELNVSETSIWDLRYPAFFPSPPESLKSQREIVWYYYLAEIALRRLGNRILNSIYDTKIVTSLVDAAESAVAFEQQAAGWLSSLPPALDLEAPSVGDERELYDSLKFILKGHLLDCYEMMYWPFIVIAVNDDTADRLSTVSSETTNAFVHKALMVCVERIEKNEQGFFYRHHGTWLMLRSCTRSALVLLAAARLDRLSLLMPDRWQHAVDKVIEMLRYWRWESRDLDDRLRLIETLFGSLRADDRCPR